MSKLLVISDDAVAAFYRHGMPGMRLEEPETKPPVWRSERGPEPLVKRCGCGRRISENKASCAACAGDQKA